MRRRPSHSSSITRGIGAAGIGAEVDTGPSPIHRSTSLTIERKVTGALNCAGYGGSPAVLSATVADDAMIEVAHVSAGAESRAAIDAGASMLIASNAVAAECGSVSTVAG